MGYFDDLRFVSAGVDMAYAEPFDQRWPDLFSIQYLHRGSMTFGRDGAPTVTLTGPAAYWIEPAHTYQLARADGDDLRHYVNFRGARGKRLLLRGADPLSDAGWVDVREPKSMDALFRDIARHHDEATPASHARAVVLLEQVLVALMDSASRQPKAQPHHDEIMSSALAMQRDPRTQWNFRKLAASLHMSFSNFRRLFRKYLGHPPQEFLLLCRMRAAARDLEDARLQVKDVAYRAGYDDPSQFSRDFRKAIGVSPSRYRESVT